MPIDTNKNKSKHSDRNIERMKNMPFLIIGWLIGIVTGIFITSLCVVSSSADNMGVNKEDGKIDD